MEIDKEIHNQTDNKVPKECIQYTYIAAVNIDSVMKIDKKKLSSSLFRRMQIWDKGEKDGKIYWCWIRSRWF